MRKPMINYSLLSALPTAPLLSSNCTRQGLPGVCGNENIAINSKYITIKIKRIQTTSLQDRKMRTSLVLI